MRRFILIFFCLLLHFQCAKATNYLFQKSKTEYTILLEGQPIQTSQTAAEELQYYLTHISGAAFSITTSVAEKQIVLHVNQNMGENYQYRVCDDKIVIQGDEGRGILYGVYAFLENEFGVRWLTPSCTIIPKLKKYKLHPIDVSATPAFDYRLVYFHDALFSPEWCAHNLLNTQEGYIKNKYGNMEAWWGMHTFGQLVPAKKFFAQHPEYFSFWKGERVDDGQLCLSNPAVLDVLCESLMECIRTTPNAYVYDVSQNDNLHYCECQQCSALAQQYGGQSGLLIWFVNQVAERINKVYPDKMIGTFAYRYTRAVPQNIRPSKNVAIRLCSFECCFCHSLNACQRNEDFYSDIQQWSKITSNLHVYDYCVGFMQYVAPHPYFRPLKDRLQTFHDVGIQGVLELGSYDANWSDFSELRQWVAAKLLWNPAQNVDSLAHIFINAYYGKVSKNIWKYYLLTQNMVSDDAHFTIYCDYKNSSYSSEFMKQGRKLLEKAYQQVRKDTILSRRVARVYAQILYLEALQHPVSSKFNGTTDLLHNIAEGDPTYFMEHRKTLDDAIKHWEGI